MTDCFGVIPNSFQDPNNGRTEGKKTGRQAVISEQSSRKTNFNFHPYKGKVRKGFNQSNNISLLPTLDPSLIRDGDNTASRFTSHSSLKQKMAFTLVEGATHVVLWNKQRKIAFTLAEVLITLGIIGVVAAMTMPTLIANHQKKQTVVALKRAYTVISNALQMARAEHGDPELWELGENNNIQDSSDFADMFLIPYLNVIKTCGTDTSGGCSYEYTALNGNATSASSLSQFTRFVLNDGTIVFVRSQNDPGAVTFPKIIYINVDINGFKKPNKSGRDYFQFAVALETNEDMYKPTGRLNASGQSQTRETITGSGPSACSRNSQGNYCAALIMHDNWEISKEYPW